MAFVPKRGDIVWTDFDPAAGHEQAHKRPALVLSPEPFNKKTGLALVAPITSRERGHGFEVKLVGTDTQGVILCQQVKTIDFAYRGIRLIERAPAPVLDEALAKVQLLVS
jgi:mRNA interferase MazF